jgi:hypothetical protein
MYTLGNDYEIGIQFIVNKPGGHSSHITEIATTEDVPCNATDYDRLLEICQPNDSMLVILI